MKKGSSRFVGGFALGALALVLAGRYRRTRSQILAWQERRRPALDVLACPRCHGALALASFDRGAGYHCPACDRDYPVVNGIGRLLEPQDLAGLNKSLAGLYDLFSWLYRPFSKVAFAFIGLSEEEARREVTGRLDPRGGRVLEVSVGPGVNLPYLVDRPDVGELYGLDISLGQLNRCAAYAAEKRWDVQLDLGNAEHLPYADKTFDGVLHIGGINFFNDKRRAIQEMVRVAKPGARIVIGDETEKGAHGYEWIIPGFKGSFRGEREVVRPPVDLLPEGMLETRLSEMWNGWFYRIEFVKPG